jgi:hypothetical protein
MGHMLGETIKSYIMYMYILKYKGVSLIDPSNSMTSHQPRGTDAGEGKGDSWWRFASPSYWVSKVLGESGLTVSAGVKDVSFLARVGVSLRPLMSTGPMPIGGLAVYLLNSPYLDVDMTGAADVLDWPVIDKAIRSVIIRQIRSALVLPNRIFVPLVDDEPMASSMDLLAVQSANIAGVLLIRSIKAHKLRSADLFSASDPYCVLELGSSEIRTGKYARICVRVAS